MAIWNRSKSSKPDAEPGAEPEWRPAAVPVPRKSPKTAEIFRLGKSLCLKGELVGSTDVEIGGTVEGLVRLDGRRLVIEKTGRMRAEISARSVKIYGQVVGNVTASERILIGSGGCVLGDLCAPSIQLEDGSQFTGGINRESTPAKVTGRLSGNTVNDSPQSAIEDSLADARRQGLYDRRG